MKNKEAVFPSNGPKAVGTYSPAVKVGNTVYLSGQIPLIPETMTLPENIAAQIHQVFSNLKIVCEASGGTLHDIVKLNVYLTDLANFPLLNQIMPEYFVEPYPARAAIGVSQLPRGSMVEMDGIMVI